MVTARARAATPPRAAAGSLHQRILGEIEARILTGEWPPGHRIPFEHELTTRYGCSRMTVNKVLTQLAGAGLIERRRKAGSFVRRPQFQLAILTIQDIRTEVEARGLAYRFTVAARRHRRAGKADSPRLAVPAGTPLLALTCHHFAGSQPFCLEERLINLAAVPEAADALFADEPPGTWLVDRVPWSTAEHRIRACGAGPAAAALFGIPEGTACLVVERRTFETDQPVTAVRLTYRGDAHELVARFTPSQS